MIHSTNGKPPGVKPRLTKELAEAVNFLGAFRDLGTVYGGLFNSDGMLWDSVSGTGVGGAFWTAFYWMSTIWFNRMQRYTSRFCYLSNGYGATAINDLTTLALGEGFTYTNKDGTPNEQLDEWMEENDWHEFSREMFINYLTDGEDFIRIYGEGVESRVLWLDPDLIYSEGNDSNDYFAGLEYEAGNAGKPDAFRVWDKPYGSAGGIGERVPAEQMQHRANKHWGQKRGFAWALPVLQDIFACDAFSGNIIGTADLLAKVAIIRQHEAPQGAVEMLKGQIQSQAAQWGPPIGQNGTPPVPPSIAGERVPPASIFDASKGTEYVTLPIGNYAQFIEVLDAELRKISGHFFLPATIYIQSRGEAAPYSGELAAGSWNVRNIKRLQDHWKRKDMQLFKMCGLDVKDLQVQTPEVAVPDKKGKQAEEEMLLRNQVISRATVAKLHDLDWEAEKAQILEEQETFRTIAEQPEEEGETSDTGNKE